MSTLPRGLRARTSAGFAVLALLASAVLSIATYQLSRWYLLHQRESLATRQVMVDALVARNLVAASSGEAETVLASLTAQSNARAVLHYAGDWYALVVELDRRAIPDAFVERVERDGPSRQRVRVSGVPYVPVGVPLAGLDATYFEFVPLVEYERTLRTLLAALLAGATATTVGGALAGWWAARRVVRPLGEVSVTAKAIAEGDLRRRLDVRHDVDLEPVAEAFNEMAEALERRIERELRFTADVSHELRTPLTAMASAVSLARREQLSPRADFAVRILDEQVDHFRRLTLELLEISRLDVGIDLLHRERTDVAAIARRAVDDAGLDPATLELRLGDDPWHDVDPARFERILANLLENAERYAGGATSVVVEREGPTLRLVVDDQGPGVAADEREAIFSRFHRGSAPQPSDRPKGTGLGLSLVDEHARLHGGRAFVTDAPGGGARFVVELPLTESDVRPPERAG